MDKNEKVKIKILDVSEIPDKTEDKIDVSENEEFFEDEIIEEENFEDEDECSNNGYSELKDDIKQHLRDLSSNWDLDLDDVKCRAKERKGEIKNILVDNTDRLEKFSDLGRNLADDIFYGTMDVYNRAKYNRNRNEGREIRVDKKE
ncbi:MAG: hypothetical protein Q4P18_07615 [Methanobrevibacter sp.]|uniref:hypothetical protein n=1 Tax=Methanobrevibacter sp. TaxID=66852 RepID=UPI0026E10DCA|nr:hypothetical protein [Methanobrevibacter sp.]MDO5849386.1 hypothetical protein [Methanobrevibacter sp.]